jgi:hypothetical protein
MKLDNLIKILSNQQHTWSRGTVPAKWSDTFDFLPG